MKKLIIYKLDGAPVHSLTVKPTTDRIIMLFLKCKLRIDIPVIE